MPSAVRFQLRDIFHPSPLQLLWELYGKTSLQGDVIAVTRAGDGASLYLAVRVRDVSEPVIVPAAKTSSIPLLEPF